MERDSILVVDDEKELRDLIGIYLSNDGYNVLKAANGFEAIEIIKKNSVALVVLDIMLPGIDGINTCLKIREANDMPIIMLSAKSQDVDKILGLNTGADDYLAKPFNPLELLARIKSQLRRRCKDSMAATGEEIRIDDLTINIGSHKVMRGLMEIKLTPKEFTILELLARNRGLVFSIQHIYERAWKEEFVQSDNTVMVHIRKIREKIEENPRMPRYIKTVWGVGYKFE